VIRDLVVLPPFDFHFTAVALLQSPFWPNLLAVARRTAVPLDSIPLDSIHWWQIQPKENSMNALRIFAQLALLGTAATGAAHALGPCSNATLEGDYAFTITGQILAPAPAAGLVAGVAKTHFDGHGNMTQIDHVVHNGVTPVEEWRPGSGPYQVNADCTGSMTITAEPTDPADGSPELKLFFVIGENGKVIRTVVSGSPTVPPFMAAITSIGTKVEPFDHVW
jgi:hypothetical protein